MLGRAQARRAARARRRRRCSSAAALAPQDSGVLHGSAPRDLAAGDAAGMAEAAKKSLRISPEQPPAREMLAVAAFAPRRLSAAPQRNSAKLDEEGRRSEAAGVLTGNTALVQRDARARAKPTKAALRAIPGIRAPGSGLAASRRPAASRTRRSAARRGSAPRARQCRGGGALGAASRCPTRRRPRRHARRWRRHRPRPGRDRLALTLATVLIRSQRDAPSAIALLNRSRCAAAAAARRCRSPGRKPTPTPANGPKREAEARSALAEDPKNSQARLACWRACATAHGDTAAPKRWCRKDCATSPATRSCSKLWSRWHRRHAAWTRRSPWPTGWPRRPLPCLPLPRCEATFCWKRNARKTRRVPMVRARRRRRSLPGAAPAAWRLANKPARGSGKRCSRPC